MNSYSEEKALRIQQFERHLQAMVQRRGKERKGDCAIIFSDEPPDGLESPHLTESAVLQPEVVAAGDEDRGAGPGDILGQGTFLVPEQKLPPSNSGGQGGHSRYVQFAFMKRTFYMDLPTETLAPKEARQLLLRPGFVRLRNRRFLWMNHREWTESVQKHDPVQKEYLNADTRAAAEDVGFILYTLWRFPPDWQFYYRALRFEGVKPRDWEGEGRVG